jgi:hypothetical protein
LALLLTTLRRSRREIRSLLIAGIIGSVLAAVALLSAPGNAARVAASAVQTKVPPPRDWLVFLSTSWRFGFDCVLEALRHSRPTSAAVVFLPAFVAFCFHRHNAAEEAGLAKWLVLLPMIAILLVICCFVPSAYVAAYVRSAYTPQDRLVVVPEFAFFCCAGIWGYLAGLALRRVCQPNQTGVQSICVALAAGLLIVPINMTRRTLALTPILRQYAVAQEEMHRRILESNPNDHAKIVVRAPPSTGFVEGRPVFLGLPILTADPTDWVNQCAADYYGLDSISIE